MKIIKRVLLIIGGIIMVASLVAFTYGSIKYIDPYLELDFETAYHYGKYALYGLFGLSLSIPIIAIGNYDNL